MSSPSPVDPSLPEPRPRAIAASGSAMPGPASETSTITASSPLCTSTANAVPSGVCRNTLPSRASRAAARSVRATGIRTGRSAPATRTLRPSSSASADQNAMRSRTTSAASHPAPGPAATVCGLASRAVRMMVSTSRSSWATAALVCSAAGPSPRDAAFSRSTVSGVRSRWDRSAANSRSFARSWTTWSAIELNATAASRSSFGPSSGTRAPSFPSPSSCAPSTRRRAGRTIRTPSRSATATEPTISATPTPASTAQAVASPSVTSESGTYTSTTAISPELSATGWSRVDPPGTSEVEARPSRRTVAMSSAAARCRPRSTAAASPEAGMCTAMSASDPAEATTRSNWSRSVVMDSAGATAAACRSALERARSRAISRMTSPSGTAKATTTMVVTARQTLTSAHLIAAAPHRVVRASRRRRAGCAGSAVARRSPRAFA